jgi:ABC-2 type transport system permease protein
MRATSSCWAAIRSVKRPNCTVCGACLVALFFIGELGPMIPLDQWVMDVSPFSHLPKLPGPAFDVMPLVALTAVAMTLGIAGLVGFSRRDVG